MKLSSFDRFFSKFFLFQQVLTASSEDEVEVLVKLLQQKDNGSVLLDQQTVLITSQDTNEAIFNFAAVATNADKLTIEVSRRLPLISLESKTTTRLCF